MTKEIDSNETIGANRVYLVIAQVIRKQNSLATWDNKCSRHLEVTDGCPLCGVEQEDGFHAMCRCPSQVPTSDGSLARFCGVEPEDGFHAMCRCPLAMDLWRAMVQDWPVPRVKQIANTGPEWVFSLLEPLSETIRIVVLMTMWRIWHVRNEITHETLPPTTEASRRFLHSYINSLLCIHQWPEGNLEKGKLVVQLDAGRNSAAKEYKSVQTWTLPPAGWNKLNVDGSYVQATGAAGGGMVLRSDNGAIIFSACREIRACANSLQAELEACKEGLMIALNRTQLPIIVELDSTEAAQMIKAKPPDRSRFHVLVQEIKSLITNDPREISFSAISRSQNKVSHALAAYGRGTPRTAVWLGSGLSNIVELVLADLPP